LKFQEKLNKASQKNNSLLCVGLDVDLSKAPKKYDSIFSFNKSIIDATQDLVCAYKPNIAFYEQYGSAGIEALIETIAYIHKFDIPVILDAKRGDIGNSSAAYAKAIFEVYKADAVTVNPYMGSDSIQPFMDYKGKGIFVLCLTSNRGAQDFQPPIFKSVAKKFRDYGLVVGATKPEELREVRQIAPHSLLLIPGIGAQGGDLASIVKIGGKDIIINASRSIIYADDPRKAAEALRDKINGKNL
jgi:orotidine 5'-phosphate decarboxylase subfamily 2